MVDETIVNAPNRNRGERSTGAPILPRLARRRKKKAHQQEIHNPLPSNLPIALIRGSDPWTFLVLHGSVMLFRCCVSLGLKFYRLRTASSSLSIACVSHINCFLFAAISSLSPIVFTASSSSITRDSKASLRILYSRSLVFAFFGG